MARAPTYRVQVIQAEVGAALISATKLASSSTCGRRPQAAAWLRAAVFHTSNNL